MVVLASFVLVALAVAEADPQFGRNVNIREHTRNLGPILRNANTNPGSFITAGTVAAQPQFGHNVNIGEPTRNVGPSSNSGNIFLGSFFAAQQVAPVQAAPAPTVIQPEDYSNIDYDYDYIESDPGIIEQDHPHPVQADESCGSGCGCTNLGGLCIPIHQYCTHPVPGGGDCKPKPSSKRCKCCLKPTVYKQDIENTVAYFLKNIAVYNITTGLKNTNKKIRTLDQTAKNALSNIIETFAQHLPLKDSTVRFLNCLSSILPKANPTITGNNLRWFYSGCSKQYQEQPQVREWVGCRNIEQRALPGWQSFRSYPCGVWTTFHYITVKLTDEPEPQQNGTIILQTLHKMVKHFPWCRDCKHHFLSMYNNTALYGGADAMNTSKEAVMWLWKGHNIVTARTANTKSKITNCQGKLKGTDQGRSQWQFPGLNQCPACQSSISQSKHCSYPQYHQFDGCFKHDHDEVYHYLRTIYSKPL